MAQSEPAGGRRNFLYAETLANLVEIDITRLGKGLLQIHPAMSGPFPTVEGPPPKGDAAPTMVPRLRRDNPFLQRCQRHKGLKGRAWRILAPQGPIGQRAERILYERPPFVGLDTERKEIRIKCGTTGQSQHLSGLDGKDCNGPLCLAERLLDLFLQFKIKR